MAGDGARTESRYADRSDGAERKMALLSAARQRGDYRLAEALADSLKDGLKAERLLRAGESAGSEGITASDWRPVAELPETWRRWAEGWSSFQVLALAEEAGVERVGETVDVPI